MFKADFKDFVDTILILNEVEVLTSVLLIIDTLLKCVDR